MEHFFTLTVAYKGEAQEYQTRLVTFGYTFKFHVIIDKREIVFERDDEMNLRALDAEHPAAKPLEKDLLEAIALSLEQLP